jgi:GntR family transcriptional regulator, rspAB operon transcriptional repressor
LQESTSKQKIYRDIRRAIIMAHCEPGERLVVEELARQYETSITPVRDALHKLEQEGLVDIKPRSGYFVSQMTLKELRDLLDLREILEQVAVERLASSVTDEQIRRLEQVHVGYTGDDDESYYRYTDENREFHCMLAGMAGNQELAKTVRHLHDRLARFMVMCQAGQKMEYTHARVIEALRKHDVTAARQALLADIHKSRDEVLDHVIQEDSAFWQLGASNI